MHRSLGKSRIEKRLRDPLPDSRQTDKCIDSQVYRQKVVQWSPRSEEGAIKNRISFPVCFGYLYSVMKLSKAVGLCPKTVTYEKFSSGGKGGKAEITAFSDKQKT